MKLKPAGTCRLLKCNAEAVLTLDVGVDDLTPDEMKALSDGFRAFVVSARLVMSSK